MITNTSSTKVSYTKLYFTTKLLRDIQPPLFSCFTTGGENPRNGAATEGGGSSAIRPLPSVLPSAFPVPSLPLCCTAAVGVRTFCRRAPSAPFPRLCSIFDRIARALRGYERLGMDIH